MNLKKHIKSILIEETNEGLMDDLGRFFRPKKNKHSDPEFIRSEKERFTCEDCGNPDYNMYMVNDDIWSKYGNNDNTLCMSCLQDRMDRELNKDDFSQHSNTPANQYNPEVQDILGRSINESEDIKKSFIRYEKLINKLVYMVFDEGICGFSWDVIKLHDREGISIRIILHFTEDSFRDFDYERYGQSKQELKGLIEDFLPKFNGIFIAYDTTKCDETHKEEETEGVGGYAAPAFEMKPDHVHFKHLYNESELTERCWKGYTQKGMKTMFGKRYPNCVKIKKKKSLRESIKNMLDEEVTKKYSKPNEKLDKVVYKWLDNYFEGSQIYKNEYWKYHGFSFEFCKNGREIADLRVEFDDRSPDWGPSDKRPTNERTVKEVMLFIYPVMIDELITDIPIRKNYLLYLIEEWFEDTQLDKIQQGFNRNDLSLDYVSVFEHRKRGDICVPPIQKPEDITMQEMMDYIKKNTLFSYKDMEEREEEEPGWIEDTYLGKLHSKEKERVNQEDRDNNPEPFNDGY